MGLSSLLVIMGILMILENFNIIKDVSLHWPILILLAGLGFSVLYFQNKKNDPVLIWLGTFLFQISIFFYYFNLTSWNNMAGLWPFFFGFAGLSFLTVSILMKNMIISYFALSFLSLFLILYLGFGVSSRLWPISMVIFGLSLMILDFLRIKADTRSK